jgi:NitT/TauT family transport system permease protein
MSSISMETAGQNAAPLAATAAPESPLRAILQRVLHVAVPLATLVLMVCLWQWYVTAYKVPRYILPGPMEVIRAFIADYQMLFSALWVTLSITFSALALALGGGVVVAVAFSQSPWLERIFYPYAVVLQVTPIVAIAPLLIIYAPSTHAVLLMCAFLVAFFPILSNMTQGLKSTDHNLLNLFDIYNATAWQRLRYVKLPGALPYFATGLRIGGGLALIGSVVAEFTAGSAGTESGLAFRILEAGRRLNVPRLFAALLLITATGVTIFFLTSFISHLLLRRWHESALTREN